MKLTKNYLYVKKSELPLAIVTEDDSTENIVVQQLKAGKRKSGSCVRDASKDLVRKIRRLIQI